MEIRHQASTRTAREYFFFVAPLPARTSSTRGAAPRPVLEPRASFREYSWPRWRTRVRAPRGTRRASSRRRVEVGSGAGALRPRPPPAPARRWTSNSRTRRRATFAGRPLFTCASGWFSAPRSASSTRYTPKMVPTGTPTSTFRLPSRGRTPRTTRRRSARPPSLPPASSKSEPRRPKARPAQTRWRRRPASSARPRSRGAPRCRRTRCESEARNGAAASLALSAAHALASAAKTRASSFRRLRPSARAFPPPRDVRGVRLPRGFGQVLHDPERSPSATSPGSPPPPGLRLRDAAPQLGFERAQRQKRRREVRRHLAERRVQRPQAVAE